MLDTFEYNNEEESEMAQLHSIHIHMNAVSRVQQQLAIQRARTTAEYCRDCGESIPDERRQLVQGCRRCVTCESQRERI